MLYNRYPPRSLSLSSPHRYSRQCCTTKRDNVAMQIWQLAKKECAIDFLCGYHRCWRSELMTIWWGNLANGTHGEHWATQASERGGGGGGFPHGGGSPRGISVNSQCTANTCRNSRNAVVVVVVVREPESAVRLATTSIFHPDRNIYDLKILNIVALLFLLRDQINVALYKSRS